MYPECPFKQETVNSKKKKKLQIRSGFGFSFYFEKESVEFFDSAVTGLLALPKKVVSRTWFHQEMTQTESDHQTSPPTQPQHYLHDTAKNLPLDVIFTLNHYHWW